MNTFKKWQIAIVLVLTCNLILRAAQEPNDPNRPQIKFEISDQEMSLGIVGPIKPTCQAEVILRYKRSFSIEQEDFLETSVGASMSPRQREFLDIVGHAFYWQDHTEKARNHIRFVLYAVSEADARRMVKALIEILEEGPKQLRLEYARRLRAYREEMAKAKGLLPGKEALLPNVKAEYDKIKKDAHPFLADTEAAEQAKQTIIEMGKMLDTLDVELAGIREKLKVIQDYWNQDGAWTKEAFAKLQEMQIVQTIELKGAEARRKAAVAIRQREKNFLDLFEKWGALESEVKQLKSTIESRERKIAQYEEALANPQPAMLPPKIYENKVVIYPVKPD
ncbi:MAG: hypothetical protein ACYS8Z_05845 [Planctomycetota bacterium]